MGEVDVWEQVRLDSRSNLSVEASGHSLELSWSELSSPRWVGVGPKIALVSGILGAAALAAILLVGANLEVDLGLLALAPALCLVPAALGGLVWALGKRRITRSLNVDAAGVRPSGRERIPWDRIEGTHVGPAPYTQNRQIKIPLRSSGGAQGQEGTFRLYLGPGERRWTVHLVGRDLDTQIAQGIFEFEAEAIRERVMQSHVQELAPADPAAQRALDALLQRSEDGATR